MTAPSGGCPWRTRSPPPRLDDPPPRWIARECLFERAGELRVGDRGGEAGVLGERVGEGPPEGGEQSRVVEQDRLRAHEGAEVAHDRACHPLRRTRFETGQRPQENA